MSNPIYYDTETTGLNFENDRIIEIAAYDPTFNKTFHSLINPKITIPPESSKIHNITDEMVKNAPTFEELSKDFIKFCEGNFILIAHNNDNFDIHFLKAEFTRINKEMPSWRFIDSLKWAKKYRPDIPSHSLQYLREIYKIEKNEAHRALNDVYILEKVFRKMIDDLSFDQIYNMLKKNFKMPFGKYKGIDIKKIPKDYIKWLLANDILDKHIDLKENLQKIGII
ncbi:MAG: DNA polymerase III subunit epsilon [Chlamydiae bacterium SM23_39]|nr:MAG: DNA polymerase III subunit epsilon [Chlamydiae bacterium SM23_39]